MANLLSYSTDDDARKAMRQDGGKLKEVQVRLFLSSRAEMQEVIETARQTTLSLMQMQRQQQLPAVVTTPAPQIVQPLPTSIQPQVPMILTTATPMLAAHQQLYPTPQLAIAADKTESSSSKRRSRTSRSRSRSRDRSRDRYRRRSSRSRSRSPKSRRGRSHRDRSDSRDRDRRRSRTSRFDKDSSKSSTDKRSNVAENNGGVASPNAIMPQVYQQNAAAFATNGGTIQPFLMPNQIDQNMLNLSQQQNHMGAFSTNDVRKMNLAMQSNPLAFSQMYAQQQQQQNVSASAFSTFSSNMPLQNQVAIGALNPMALPNAVGASSTGGNNAIHCVRIRNLCNFTNYGSIRKFFSGLPIPNDGIKIIHDNDGNRTGQAYVRFVRPQSVSQAIARSNQKVGRNVIQIQELEDKVYDEAIDAYRPPRRNNYRSDPRSRDRDRDRRDDGRRSGRRRGDTDSNDEFDDDDRNSSKGNSDNDRDNDVMCISDSNDSKEKESAPFTTVLIEDLPPFTKEQDIMKMFSSYPLVHIVMAKRPKMFSSYVRFHNADDARAAVKNTACHKISFKTVYVSACCEQEYETARREFSGDVDFELSSPKANEAPNYADYRKAEAEMSNEIKSPDPSSETQNDTDSSANQNDDEPPKLSLEGIPGVNLADPRMLKFQANAMGNATSAENPINERIDPRTRAAVQPVDTSSFGNSMVENNPYAAASNGTTNGGPTELPVCCILIENMEYRTTEQEIAQWLMQNVNLTPIRIQLLVNNRNQTNGEAFIQFADNEQAMRAATLHQTRFKSRSVRVSLATWQQVQETLNKIHEMLLSNGFGGINSSNSNFSRDQNRGGGPNVRYNNGHGNNNHRMNNARSNNNHGNVDRCVVAVSNVPYKANIDDILDFFEDFDVTPENVIRRYNDEGKPTGDARICFKSPMEARRAVDQKDKCRIMNRPVFLNIL